jgi:hypothetical protein
MRLPSLNALRRNRMPAQKKREKSRPGRGSERAARVVPVASSSDVAVEVPVPRLSTDVVTERTYVTTEPEVEIRKPATLAQALTEPAVAVVKPKRRVRKEVARTRRSA